MNDPSTMQTIHRRVAVAPVDPLDGMKKYRHLVGVTVHRKLREEVVSSIPGRESAIEVWEKDTVVALSRVVTASGGLQGEYAVMKSGQRVPLDKVYIETILFGQVEEVAFYDHPVAEVFPDNKEAA